MARNLDDVSRALAAEKPEGRRRFLGRTLAVFGVGAAAVVGLDPGVADATACPAGFKACSGSCRDVAINPDHCGACGHVCPNGSSCRNGVCVDCVCGPVCPTGQVQCSAKCVNLATDPRHCGTCTKVCASGQVCTNGVCQAGPPPPQCAVPFDCPGVDTECKTRTCVAGVCGFSFTPSGTAVAAQIAGDCKKNVCDGAGNIAPVPDDSDLPDDFNECTLNVCAGGVPSNPLAPAGTDCTGGVCDGNGVCGPRV
jgi:Stigma-specific protein, Stig1.